MGSQNDLSQKLTEMMLAEIKKYVKYYKSIFGILFIFNMIIIGLFYFKKFNSTIELNQLNTGIVLMLLLMAFIFMLSFLANFSQLCYVADTNEDDLKIFLIYRGAFVVVIFIIIGVIFCNLKLDFLNIAFAIYLISSLMFIYIVNGIRIFNIFTIGILSVIAQDIFLFASLLLIFSKNIMSSCKIIIAIILLSLYFSYLYFGYKLRKNKKINWKIIISTFIICCVEYLFIVYLAASNLVSASGLANINTERKIERVDLPDEIKQILDKNPSAFSCKNLNNYSCFEKKGDDSYEIKNLRYLAKNNGDTKLYCIILPKDNNSTLNNLAKENCLKILPEGENIYIDLKGIKNIQED
ncbi:MAG: hypothetical protein J6M21_07355 [Campylobacter sp.]|nr:hypothetical protein [Campylobacter sp.]